MKHLQRAAVLVSLANSMRREGSWCGETHLQKATYFLQEAAHVPMDLSFVLYKHGPYSFDLHGEISSLLSTGILHLEAQPYPYGPSFVPTSRGQQLLQRFPKTLARHEDSIQSVAKHLGSADVLQLERLATALYVLNENPRSRIEELVEQMCSLKPHITGAEALEAIERVRETLANLDGHFVREEATETYRASR
jgi:uncharacterized protein YwgA